MRLGIDYGPGLQGWYFGWDGVTFIVLLGGGDKRRQAEDIRKAQERWADYKARKRKGTNMALTRSFRETVALRAAHDGAFRAALLEEALQATLDGELDEAKSLLRDYINATVGFDTLSDATRLPVKV